MKRIALIGATGKDWWEEKKSAFVHSLLPPSGYKILNLNPSHGTHSLESHADEAYNAAFILCQVIHANRENFDAAVLDCAEDPVLDAAREVSSIPVVGPRKTCLHLARTLGTRFAIVTVQGSSLVKVMQSAVIAEGLQSFCAGIGCLRIPVLDIAKAPDKAQAEVEVVCREMIENHGADTIVLGCTGLSYEIDIPSIQQRLGVPILDPLVVAIKTAILLIESHLSHSKVAYPHRPESQSQRIL